MIKIKFTFWYDYDNPYTIKEEVKEFNKWDEVLKYAEDECDYLFDNTNLPYILYHYDVIDDGSAKND
jgi:hypothetical protein